MEAWLCVHLSISYVIPSNGNAEIRKKVCKRLAQSYGEFIEPAGELEVAQCASMSTEQCRNKAECPDSSVWLIMDGMSEQQESLFVL